MSTVQQIVVVDIGCRWGFAEKFIRSSDLFIVYGFDPDQEECARLSALYGNQSVHLVPFGLAGVPGKRTLWFTAEPACSSLLEPDPELTRCYPALHCAQHVRRFEVDTTTLDLWAKEAGVDVVDYIKVDTQGTELEILRGGTKVLSTVRCLEVEVEFNPIYLGQPLFAEVDIFLRSQGFVLWNFSNHVHYTRRGEQRVSVGEDYIYYDDKHKVSHEVYGGQLYWANAHYIKKDVLEWRPTYDPQRLRDVILFKALDMSDVVQHIEEMQKDKGGSVIISYAQNFEDVMLWRALKHIKYGFYIDVGAWSPDLDSVTRIFYEHGWNGVNVEPNPEFYRQLRERRPRDQNLCVAVGDHEGSLTMNFMDNLGLSTLDDAIATQHKKAGWHLERSSVQVTTLSILWQQYVSAGQDVHFLKVDVEGFEKAVLLGNDWTNHRPWIVVIEATLPMSQIESHTDWEQILFAANYQFVYADGLNRFYVADEHGELVSAFKYPPNVFDDFVLASQVNADTRAQQAEDRANQAQAQAQQAEDRANQIQTELHGLLNSRSWRFTAPLRNSNAIVRKAKSYIKVRLKTIIKRSAAFVKERPWLKPLMLVPLAPFPGVKERLRRAAGLFPDTAAITFKQDTEVTSTPINLSPRAREIYKILKKRAEDDGFQ